MGEEMKVSLSNPLGVFLGSFMMFLTGIAIGEHWHLSKTVALAVTFSRPCWPPRTRSCHVSGGAR
jgi:hypothetical protein